MSKANERQVGGTHYKGTACPHCGESIEHWDLAWLFRWDNFQYAITKYVMRWREKAGIDDLRKAQHCLEKYIEVVLAEDPNKFKHIPGKQRAEVARPGEIDMAGNVIEPHEVDALEGVGCLCRFSDEGGEKVRYYDKSCPVHGPEKDM